MSFDIKPNILSFGIKIFDFKNNYHSSHVHRVVDVLKQVVDFGFDYFNLGRSRKTNVLCNSSFSLFQLINLDWNPCPLKHKYKGVVIDPINLNNT